MSTLRIIGLVFGILLFSWGLFYYRGEKWRRGSFLLTTGLALALVLVSASPSMLNTITEALSFHQVQRGRIMAALVISVFVLFFLVVRNRTRYSEINHQLDLLIRWLSVPSEEAEFARSVKSIMVLIPAYNEADNLPSLLARIPASIEGQDVGVIVIDDGSKDDTHAVAKAQGVLAVRGIVNRGQGAASRIGYDLARRYGAEIVVTMDADNQHDPHDIVTLVRPIRRGQLDLVIGSRVLGTNALTNLWRRIGISVFSVIVNVISGLRLTDCSSGFKAFKVSELAKLDLRENQFQSTEVLIEAAKKGLRVGEVPITIDARKHGESKKGGDWHYGMNFTKVIIKTWWR